MVEGAGQCAQKHAQLESLIGLLESAVPSLDGTVDQNVPRELIPKYLYISDSIILSAPLTSSKMRGYRGLATLVMRVIQVSHLLLDKGYLLRGGISIGPVWHTDSNIVGPAYLDAYQIEAKTVVPRVELSPNAKSHWLNTEGSANTMCLEYRNSFIANVLHDYYLRDKSHGAPERAFKKYSHIVDDNLEADHSEAVRYKWWWFKEYLESEWKRNSFIIHR